MPEIYDFFATTPKQLEHLLFQELKSLGARDVKETVSGVYFRGPLSVGYRAVMWSRLANSVLLTLKSFPAATPEYLYKGVRSVDWERHLSVDSTLAVTFTSARSQITHTHYGALRVKDGIVDRFRARYDRRPSVELETPDVRVNCHVDRDRATLSIDLSGSSLHRRAYRVDTSRAPLKENVAAAVLLRARWPEIAAEGGSLVDPMCGSGTLLVEAALMAADQAPGLLRDYYGFQGWRGHDERAWKQIVAEAEERAQKGRKKLPWIMGSDLSMGALHSARNNIEAAGFAREIRIQRQAVRDLSPPEGSRPGLVVTNAPYGERIGTQHEAREVHEELGSVLKERFGGWKASVLTGSKSLGFAMNLKAEKFYRFYNGTLECILLNFDIYPPVDAEEDE